jgi:hypothetical protein
MRRIRGEPVEVWLRHGRPARFVWRGRLYTVLFVLDRRVSPPPQPSSPPEEGSQPAGQESWLVDATPQQAIAAARYELTHDLGTGRWTLARK